MPIDELGLVERLKAGAIVFAGKDLPYASDTMSQAAAAIERLLAERDESDHAASAMSSDLFRMADERERLKEALTGMVQRFELYAGPDDMHAGNHDLALLTRARQALEDKP